MRKRRSAENWKRFDFLERTTALGRSSDQIQRIFEAEDLLKSVPDDSALMDRTFRVAAAHVVEQRLTLDKGRWRSTPPRLRLAEGIEYAATIDEQVMMLLAGLEGGRTLRQVTEGIAKEMGAEFTAFVPLSVAITRSLMKKGLLAPR